MLDGSDYLCHYTRAATAFENIIPARMLMMSPYSRMRDPFENKVPPLPGSWWGSSDVVSDGLYFLVN